MSRILDFLKKQYQQHEEDDNNGESSSSNSVATTKQKNSNTFSYFDFDTNENKTVPIEETSPAETSATTIISTATQKKLIIDQVIPTLHPIVRSSNENNIKNKNSNKNASTTSSSSFSCHCSNLLYTTQNALLLDAGWCTASDLLRHVASHEASNNNLDFLSRLTAINSVEQQFRQMAEEEANRKKHQDQDGFLIPSPPKKKINTMPSGTNADVQKAEQEQQQQKPESFGNSSETSVKPPLRIPPPKLPLVVPGSTMLMTTNSTSAATTTPPTMMMKKAPPPPTTLTVGVKVKMAPPSPASAGVSSFVGNNQKPQPKRQFHQKSLIDDDSDDSDEDRFTEEDILRAQRKQQEKLEKLQKQKEEQIAQKEEMRRRREQREVERQRIRENADVEQQPPSFIDDNTLTVTDMRIIAKREQEKAELREKIGGGGGGASDKTKKDGRENDADDTIANEDQHQQQQETKIISGDAGFLNLRTGRLVANKSALRPKKKQQQQPQAKPAAAKKVAPKRRKRKEDGDDESDSSSADDNDGGSSSPEDEDDVPFIQTMMPKRDQEDDAEGQE